MKNIIIAILILGPIICSGQTVIGSGNDHTIQWNKGGFMVDSFAKIAPIRDTNGYYGRKGDFIRLSTDSSLWFYNGISYQKVGEIVDGLKWSDTVSTIATQSQVNTFINQSVIQSVTITGDSLKTATFTRGNNTFISTTFVDKDNQTLAYNSGTKTLSIKNGNSVILPIDYGELDQVISGQTSSVFTLSQPINLSKHLIIMYNTANVFPQDYSITGPNQITFHFAVTASDKFHFFYKEN